MVRVTRNALKAHNFLIRNAQSRPSQQLAEAVPNTEKTLKVRYNLRAKC